MRQSGLSLSTAPSHLHARRGLHAILAVSGAAAPSVIRLRRQGLRGPDVAALLRHVWNELEELIGKGAAVTVTERAIRVRRHPIVGDQ
jgi:hypothetical protein